MGLVFDFPVRRARRDAAIEAAKNAPLSDEKVLAQLNIDLQTIEDQIRAHEDRIRRDQDDIRALERLRDVKATSVEAILRRVQREHIARNPEH